MEKRLLMAIVLSALVLFLYNLFYYKEVEKKQKLYKKPIQQEEILPAPPSKIVKEIPVGAWEREIPTLKIKEEKLILKTNVMEIKLNPEGKIDSWQLFKFKEKDKGLVELINLPGKPLTILLNNKEFIATDFSALDGGIKEFVYTNPTMPEISVIKQFSFYPDSYAIDVRLKVVNNSATPLKGQALTLQWDSPPNPRYGTASHSTIISQFCFINGKMEKITHKAVGIMDGILSGIGLIPPVQPEDSVRVKEGKINWIAQESQYFLNILIPDEFVGKSVFTQKIDGRRIMSFVIPEINLLPNQTQSFNFKVYGGPKDMEILKSLTFGAEKLTGIDPFAGVIHFILKKLYELTHNYGIAIILLTIIIKILLHPLTKKNFKVMKNMQKKMKMIQPELAKLKEKHKDDKESLNREMMELYKRYKVNPLGGCLPMLLQMPVFFALFTTLNKSIELRGASFLVWGDLSSKDPFFILPILMGATMFIQQKMTPTPDPQQAKMGQIMTIVFTFMFINFPVGLVLYWTIQNILTIAEQCLINKGIEK